jgi:cob(I)alamin adenosyltransferase
MKIYTKGGDKGKTQVYLADIKRVSKDDKILACYGDLDELNSHIGMLAAHLETLTENKHRKDVLLSTAELLNIQKDIFSIGFAISDKPQFGSERIDFLETKIDTLQASLAPQTHFILPGGSIAAAQAHISRTVARRAERALVSLAKDNQVPEVCLAYINRLSDFLFVSARYLNSLSNKPDIVV